MYLGMMLMLLAVGASSISAQDSPTMSGGSKMQMSGKANPDAKFMMMAATGGMNEIALSQQALAKSSNDDVKRYAQMMIDDHTKAGDELKSVAMSKNVTLPMEADAKHKAAVAKMESLSGMTFDMAYLKMMVKDHEATVAMFQKEANSGKDADAKAFASNTLPTIQGHLSEVKAMTGKMSTMSNSKMSGM